MPYKDLEKRRESQRIRTRKYYEGHKTACLAKKKVYDERERTRLEKEFRFDPSYRKLMWRSAKARAIEKGLAFSISPDDIVIPEYCPVLGVKLQRNRGEGFKNSSPSLDRVIPSIGYIPGNVRVISYRANAIKRDATLAELEMLVRYLKEEQHPKQVRRNSAPGGGRDLSAVPSYPLRDCGSVKLSN